MSSPDLPIKLIAIDMDGTLLGSDGGKLDAAFAHVREISRGIQEGKSRSRLIESAQTVSADMSSLVGILTRAIEGEGQ